MKGYLPLFQNLFPSQIFIEGYEEQAGPVLETEWSTLSSNLVDFVGHTPVLEKKRPIGCGASIWS